MPETMCKIPLSAVITVQDGKAEIVSAEYQEVPADLVARFLVEKFGPAAIFGRETEKAAPDDTNIQSNLMVRY